MKTKTPAVPAVPADLWADTAHADTNNAVWAWWNAAHAHPIASRNHLAVIIADAGFDPWAISDTHIGDILAAVATLAAATA